MLPYCDGKGNKNCLSRVSPVRYEPAEILSGVQHRKTNVEIQTVFQKFQPVHKKVCCNLCNTPFCLFFKVDHREIKLIMDFGKQGMDLHLTGQKDLASAV